MVLEVKGAIHGLGLKKLYTDDGTEPMEIVVPKNHANSLPYKNGMPVTIDLQINGEHYDAVLRSTDANPQVYISQSLKTKEGISKRLAYVLTNAGFKKNDKVILEINDLNIVLKAASSSPFSIYTTDPEQGFAEGAERYYSLLDTEVSRLRSDSKARKVRLKAAPELPVSFTTTTTIFRRDPAVIAEVLDRANGYCEKCQKAAPFKRASDGSPYLEVHHHIPLSKGGKDKIANALALCPNCHREAHFGESII